MARYLIKSNEMLNDRQFVEYAISKGLIYSSDGEFYVCENECIDNVEWYFKGFVDKKQIFVDSIIASFSDNKERLVSELKNSIYKFNTEEIDEIINEADLEFPEEKPCNLKERIYNITKMAFPTMIL